MKTKEKIIECAISLFNREGFERISTNHIAAECGISPGNLYYHYRNKQEIVIEIYQKMISEFDNAMLPLKEDDNIVSILCQYWQKIVEHQQKYSFFFLNIFSILDKEPELKKLYNQNRQKRFSEINLFIKSAQDRDFLLPDDESRIKQVISAIWFVNEFWMIYERVTNINMEQQIPGNILVSLDLIRPFLAAEKQYLIEEIIDRMNES